MPTFSVLALSGSLREKLCSKLHPIVPRSAALQLLDDIDHAPQICDSALSRSHMTCILTLLRSQVGDLRRIGSVLHLDCKATDQHACHSKTMEWMGTCRKIIAVLRK